jgi:hypothetical protein
MKTVTFIPANGKLWIAIEMTGVYFITYVYQMWAATANEPPILTNPLKQGNNLNPHDDHYPVINDYNQTEPLINFDKRILDIKFWIKVVDGNDNGYNLKVTVLQGNDFETATEIGNDAITNGTVGAIGLKQEAISFQLSI